MSLHYFKINGIFQKSTGVGLTPSEIQQFSSDFLQFINNKGISFTPHSIRKFKAQIKK